MFKKKKPVLENGKTANDLAWLLYEDIRRTHPQKFEIPFDHTWWLRRAIQASQLIDDPEDLLEKQVFLDYMNQNKPKE